MYKNSIAGILRIHLSNLPGKTTRRKIVVFESDDWGSIRTHSREAFDRMATQGLNVGKNHYGNDSLESNSDLETLFNVLLECKDSTGRPPVFTPFCNMANPDFDAIKQSGFGDYHYENLHKTISQYPRHDRLLALWKEGEKNRLFCPQLHGREHIHTGRWMEMLNRSDGGMKIAFENLSVGVSEYKNVSYENYLGALHPFKADEIPNLHRILEDAGRLYHEYLGHGPTCFVAPNAEEPAELESTLKKIGITTITRAKKRVYPLGDGKYKTEWNWPGRINRYGQTILVRNVFFEPVCFGEPDKAYITNWVDNCLKEIEIAFKWKKPAVVSTHRVNYVGYINPQNREKGIAALRRLLKTIMHKWPEVEFMTSEELGSTILEQRMAIIYLQPLRPSVLKNIFCPMAAASIQVFGKKP